MGIEFTALKSVYFRDKLSNIRPSPVLQKIKFRLLNNNYSSVIQNYSNKDNNFAEPLIDFSQK